MWILGRWQDSITNLQPDEHDAIGRCSKGQLSEFALANPSYLGLTYHLLSDWTSDADPRASGIAQDCWHPQGRTDGMARIAYHHRAAPCVGHPGKPPGLASGCDLSAPAVGDGAQRLGMVFWQLTIDANDPVVMARFRAQALGFQPVPPAEPQTAWHAHYRARLGADAAFDDRLFDPAGLRPPIWFHHVPEAKAGKNRLHLDLYPTGRDSALPMERRIETKVAELIQLGAPVKHRARHDDPEDPVYHVVMHDPQGNEFCVS